MNSNECLLVSGPDHGRLIDIENGKNEIRLPYMGQNVVAIEDGELSRPTSYVEAIYKRSQDNSSLFIFEGYVLGFAKLLMI